MIFNLTNYNLLDVLFCLNLEAGLDTRGLDIVQHELFKAGVQPESASEFEIVLHELTKLQKEYYGKK